MQIFELYCCGCIGVAVVFAPQEYQSGKVIVKNMKIKNSQVEVTETCILAAVNDVLGG